MTAADDAHAELMRALTVERFTHLPETPPGPRGEPAHVTKARLAEVEASNRHLRLVHTQRRAS